MIMKILFTYVNVLRHQESAIHHGRIHSWIFELSDGITPFKFQKFIESDYTHSFFNFLGRSRLMNPVLIATNIITSLWKSPSVLRLCANKCTFLFPTKTELMRLNSVFQTRLV